MKLCIGENIRRHRRELDLTQEQLGDQLGVSYQAISRWENGTAYPDIEFLPILANFFEVSVDELLGYSEDARKNRASKLIEQMKDGTQDAEQVIGIIREMRREHLFDCGYDFWLKASNIYRIPGVLPELRMTAEAILAKSTNKRQREYTIYYMAQYEDDEHFESFLKKHSALLDLTHNNLCLGRYEFRRETDKYEVMKQYQFRNTIVDLTGGFQMGENDRELSADEMLRVLKFQLGVLNWLCRIEPTQEHPVFCDDTIDEWSVHRASIGLHLVGCLASTADTDGAFAALEDIVSMLEKILKQIAETEEGRIEVKVRCEWLDKAKVAIKPFDAKLWGAPMLVTAWEIGDEECLGHTYIHEGGCGMDNVYFVLTSDKYRYKHLLDPIRDDPRYKEYVDRITANLNTCK